MPAMRFCDRAQQVSDSFCLTAAVPREVDVITAAKIACWLLAGMFATQALPLTGFAHVLRSARRRLLVDDECPAAAVVLCLRGKDPSLSSCIEGLFGQDYPDYEVHIIFDSETDPSREVLKQRPRTSDDPPLTIHILQRPLETCSLKCSSLIQVVNQLPESRKVVALLDADTIPHPGWLRELVAPLLDDKFAVSTGNRWYRPDRESLGAVARWYWNSAATVPMYYFRIPWGGTLALRVADLQNARLVDYWSRSFCEDTMLKALFADRGQSVALVPTLMMVNRESCTLPGLMAWMRRQLLTTRLYHPCWWAVVAHAFLTIAVVLVAVTVLLVSFFMGEWTAMLISTSGIAAYWLLMGVAVRPLESAMCRILADRGQPGECLKPVSLGRRLLVLPLLLIAYPLSAASVIFPQSVRWRGIRYRIRGPWNIQRETWYPFEASAEDSTNSL
jgi:hypothetical protein